MSLIGVVFFVALTGVPFCQGLPLGSTPEAYPHDGNSETLMEAWRSGSGLYAAVPALALVLTALGLLFGCTWCYRHKDCKPNEGADNQLFTASATHLHDARRSQPPDSGFSEPANNNISEANNNGPISLREMQNIANNNATAYIVSENEERNRVSRESVVEFEPLPSGIRVNDPLERCADWFAGEDFPRNQLQYLREIGRGWFGRVVEGEIEDEGATSTVAVKILNQNASLEDKARFLEESKLYRDVTHENVLAFIAKCLQEDPWILLFELCSMDLQQYLIHNRPKMAILNETGVPLQLMCDIASALSYLHSRGYLYGNVSSSNTLVRDATSASPRAVLGSYAATQPLHEYTAPETRRHPPLYTTSSEIWSLGTLIWEICTWAAPVPAHMPPPPDLPCPYRNHLYQVMQLCWNPSAEERPTCSQVHALLEHLHATHTHTRADDGDFEQRWQTLKPNTIPKVDEHVALVHAPSTSTASHFTPSEHDLTPAPTPTPRDTLSLDMDTAVSRSSSIMSDRDPLSVQIRSESLNNLHGSLEDVRNIYLTHNETAALECHQGNIEYEEREQDRSDGSVDPWVKDLIAGSQDDVSYYRDVSDVIKNLDNILNSEKTSSSESSHQASPSRDNLSLDCKKEYPIQSSMVKSPGITNFKNILEISFDSKPDEPCDDDEVDRDTIGTLSHSFERHSDTLSQHTLENLTPDTPIKDLDIVSKIDADRAPEVMVAAEEQPLRDTELPKENIDNSDSEIQSNENKQDKDKCIEKNALPESLAEIAANVIDNEVIHPAIERVSKILETEKLKSEENEKEHFSSGLDIRKNDGTEELTKPADSIKQITKSLIEEERKGSMEESGKATVVLQVTETKVEKPLQVPAMPETETLELAECTSQKILEDIFVVKNPERVQIHESIIETENVKLATPLHNIPKDEQLAFSSNFAEINLEVMNETLSTLPPYIVQNNESKKAETSSLEKINTPSGLEQQVYSKYENHDEETSLVDSGVTGQSFPVKSLRNVIHQEVNNTTEDHLEESKLIGKISSDHALDVEKPLQNSFEEKEIANKNAEEVIDHVIDAACPRSDKEAIKQSNDSTAYMDLINYTNSQSNNSEPPQDNIKECIQSCLNKSFVESTCNLIKNESTVYLDLPDVLKDTSDFLNSESVTSQEDKIIASTPKGSECSNDNTLQASKNEISNLSETKLTDETAIAKSEQKFIADLLSPFDSPTKSHPTDTYDENSSVVLGPFENCATDCKSAKAEVDLPKEELLAFSSNFSEINLETPSPLRDSNFLNEVPDIANVELQSDDITISESKKDQTDKSDETDQSATTKHISPSTPPNSPGIYLASTSQKKYLVDIELDPPETQSYPPLETDSGLSSLQKEIDLNQIELHITTKLAMAENENNLNIEYSGPLTVEGLVSEDDAILRESDAIPDTILAGNGGSVEDRSESISLDEECVQLLRNELELKLPLAQVAGIEPAGEVESESEGSWRELPPPPELVVQYGVIGGALSPIAEETRHQLTQYENDAWNLSTHTQSSESYPEPCNDSTAEVTDLPSGPGDSQHTYTIRAASPNNTYTLQKDIPTSRELTMSADSLNGSPYKKPTNTTLSPIDDKTFNKTDEEKISSCERISQVSPLLLSPTTDTSGPDSVNNATGISTLSKTTVPTDAKHSKPSMECLSKATSIDSWCSNDTLYNVEENFDDLVMEADIPEFNTELVKSASTHTLTHHEDEKETSHTSTYIVHGSQSEPCETFSPDSITANDDNTYTKVKAEATGTSPSVVSKSDVNDSTKSQTKDLAYGTLPSYSNCTTELMSGVDDRWKFSQPELVRRPQIPDIESFTPPKRKEDKESNEKNDSPRTAQASIKKMDSVELSCLQDDISSHKSESQVMDMNGSQNYNNDMAPAITSTPIIEPLLEDNDVEPIPMTLKNADNSESHEFLLDGVPNFQNFVQSAEIRPQDTTCNQDTILLLEGDSKSLSRNSDKDMSDRTPNYSDFEHSAFLKPQEGTLSSQNVESGMSSGDFRQFENSVRFCPQDLSSLNNANSAFLDSERKLSELAANSNVENSNDQTSQSRMPESIQNASISPPNPANSVESQHVIPNINFSLYVTDLDEEETDQPHSIIFTEVSQAPRHIDTKFKDSNEKAEGFKEDSIEVKENPYITFDSHTDKMTTMNLTYDSHAGRSSVFTNTENSEISEPKMNGIETVADEIYTSKQSPESPKTKLSVETSVICENVEVPNGLFTELNVSKETICNGNSQNYAIVNFINESFEELPDNKANSSKATEEPTPNEPKEFATQIVSPQKKEDCSHKSEGTLNGVEAEITSATADFLKNEKQFCATDTYHPLLRDIRFTGPTSEIMSTSFTQESPTEPEAPECERECKSDLVADIVKEWDSDSDSHSSNSSSGEFIWKDGDGHETPVVPTTHFDHQQDGNGTESRSQGGGETGGAASEVSGDSGSGSEGDEVEFVPSSWDCRAAPAKSSLRSLDTQPPTDKKRVVFKRQKYHCVYEYPRELAEVETHSPAYLPDFSTYCGKKRVVFKRQKYHCEFEYPRELAEVETHSPASLPDFSTYCEWDPTSAEEAELGYGQLYGTPMDMYQLRSGIAFGSDYDDDFFISSTARPFDTLGIMSTTSQFFPGMHVKPSLVDGDDDDVTDDFPPPPSPLVTSLTQTRTPSLDFTTPDSGVEDITPGSTSTDEDFKTKKLDTEVTHAWKPIDSASSSESVSPSSPGGEALGGLRHTRDKLKLDLPPSPRVIPPSPRHNRVFNFVLDKPKRHRSVDDTPPPAEPSPAPVPPTPLVMTDETPLVTSSLPIQQAEDVPVPEPTFSTFGKCKTSPKEETESPEQKIILTDESDEASPTTESKEESPAKSESVKGEGTVLDSGDEDSGIESSAKATLERKTNVS